MGVLLMGIQVHNTDMIVHLLNGHKTLEEHPLETLVLCWEQYHITIYVHTISFFSNLHHHLNNGMYVNSFAVMRSAELIELSIPFNSNA